MIINMNYGYKGTNNTHLMLKEGPDGDIDLVTEFNETITTIRTGRGLMEVIKDLLDGRYAY